MDRRGGMYMRDQKRLHRKDVQNGRPRPKLPEEHGQDGYYYTASDGALYNIHVEVSNIVLMFGWI